MTDPSNGVHNFGPYRLDSTRRLLMRGAEIIPLPPKTLELLLLLLNANGGALSKTELMNRLWADTFVEEANLTFQVSSLRKALGDPGAEWIQTIPRYGYRFSAPLQSG